MRVPRDISERKGSANADPFCPQTVNPLLRRAATWIVFLASAARLDRGRWAFGPRSPSHAL